MNMRRTAFTLIELLVVMALMVVLATLVIAFFPGAATSARESRAGSNLQGWLNIAKQRALRDQAPRGLRLWIAQAPNNQIGATSFNNIVVECQYIEQPDDFSVGMIQSGVPAPPAPGYTMQNCLFFNNVDLYNGYAGAPGTQQYWTVQPGDYIEIFGTGLLHRIIEVGVPNAAAPPVISPYHIRVAPDLGPLPNPIATPTSNYRIIRQPRVVGDETLKMPGGTMIDLQTNVANLAFGGQLPQTNPGFVDILFAPNGSVISPGLTTDKIHLWVRAPSENDPTNAFRGDPTLISIFVRTGFVGAYQPAQSGNPYALVN